MGDKLSELAGRSEEKLGERGGTRSRQGGMGSLGGGRRSREWGRSWGGRKSADWGQSGGRKKSAEFWAGRKSAELFAGGGKSADLMGAKWEGANGGLNGTGNWDANGMGVQMGKGRDWVVDGLGMNGEEEEMEVVGGGRRERSPPPRLPELRGLGRAFGEGDWFAGIC